MPMLPPLPALPFPPLPPLDAATRARVCAVAERAYDRYLQAFLEEHSLCPFARGGRLRGMTTRVAYFADTPDPQPIMDLFNASAADAGRAVVGVVFPGITVGPEAWRTFAVQLTEACNARTQGGPVFSVAALHPDHPYSAQSALSLIPLFRRAPDPGMQWVRLDALEAVYEGRSGKDIYVPPEDIPALLARPPPRSMFDRIAETNMKMAQRMGIGRLEADLRAIHVDAQREYERALLAEDAPATCPVHHGHPPGEHAGPMASTARAPLLREGEGVALARLEDLQVGVPVLFAVDGVELVAVRLAEEVHVLHGRCPHRLAPLDTAVVDAGRLVCARHGWSFRLQDGHAEGMADESLHRFTASTDRGMVWVDAVEVRRFRSTLHVAFNRQDLML